MSDIVRINYSYIWKGIFTREDEVIKGASEKLGVGGLYKLLACMMTKKTYDEIMSNEENLNERLKVSGNKTERERLQRYAKESAMEITHVLHEINKYGKQH